MGGAIPQKKSVRFEDLEQKSLINAPIIQKVVIPKIAAQKNRSPDKIERPEIDKSGTLPMSQISKPQSASKV